MRRAKSVFVSNRKERKMKNLYTLSKIATIALLVALVLINLAVPLLITFTTNDRSSSVEFFIDNFISLLPLVPFLLLPLFPMAALKSYASFKLGNLPAAKLKKHIIILSTAEIISLALTIIIRIIINSNNAISL